MIDVIGDWERDSLQKVWVDMTAALLLRESPENTWQDKRWFHMLCCWVGLFGFGGWTRQTDYKVCSPNWCCIKVLSHWRNERRIVPVFVCLSTTASSSALHRWHWDEQTIIWSLHPETSNHHNVQLCITTLFYSALSSSSQSTLTVCLSPWYEVWWDGSRPSLALRQ